MSHLSEVKATLRTENANALREAVGAWGSSAWSDELWDNRTEDELRIAKTPVYSLTLGQIVSLYEAIDSGDLSLTDVAPVIRAQEEQLLAAIDGVLPDCIDDRQDWGVRLVAYVAGVFVPAMTHLGVYSIAANATYRLVKRITGTPFHDVVGGGTNGEFVVVLVEV